ncbi:MAG: phosphoribosylglycinamide formyltransferase [Bacteriovoracaceae bacterium]|jgi:phosphoribosylglycinamide formyltransferase 1|nr:phosphoribosylglycinamide formyltransferase [Bacteriovoracaceae bacterium]
MTSHKINLAILASGSGTNLLNLVEVAERHKDRVDVKCLITDKMDAGFLEHPICHDYKKIVVENSPKLGDNLDIRRANHEKAVLEHLFNEEVEWILLAGYMRILTPNFLNYFYDKKLDQYKIINIHPSLLPKFKGVRAMEKSFASGDKLAGISVHFVSPEVDGGEIIHKEVIPRFKGDNYSNFSKRAKKAEHFAYKKVFLDLIYGHGKFAPIRDTI